jgi:molybdenum cofactor cytidylyltransferase
LTASFTPQVAIAVLAAGRSTRSGPHHKLLATLDGEPLVRIAARQALAAGAGPVMVITGHLARDIAAALAGLPVTTRHNPDYASGMASSIALAARSVPDGAAGLMIHLADMPLVTAAHMAAMVDMFATAGAKAIVRAAADGARGNPVLFPRSQLPELIKLTGDAGARSVIDSARLPVLPVEIGKAGALDVDTAEAVLAAGGRFPGGA